MSAYGYCQGRLRLVSSTSRASAIRHAEILLGRKARSAGFWHAESFALVANFNDLFDVQ